MAHTPLGLTAGSGTAEAAMKSLPQISLGDADVTSAKASVSTWVFINNADGSLHHVIPTTETKRPT